MRWLAKAALQGLISFAPRADAANLFLQRRVTKTLPRNEAGFVQHALEATKHVVAFERHGQATLADARAYEFGAGWDLIGRWSTSGRMSAST